jgi:uncharacterized protein (TIGR02271 family)
MQFDQLEQLRGATVVDLDGDKIGKLDEIYLDQDTNAPEWALVHTGLFGTKSTFVPLRGAEPTGDQVRVPFAKSQVTDAPGIEPGRELSQAEEAELYSYYGLSYGQQRSDSGLPEGGSPGYDAGAPTTGYDTSGPTTDSAMTRSEEQLRVGTRTEEAGRARLRKYVVTEHVTQTVPVQREELRIEREPITSANVGQAMDGPAISEEEHEVVLHQEVPVVTTEAVPVERVRLDTETVTEQHQVTENVRREEIELEEGR